MHIYRRNEPIHTSPRKIHIDLKNKRQTPTLIGVTPQHHNTYTPLMAHAWGSCWGIRGSLGEACKCLCTGRYKDT